MRLWRPNTEEPQTYTITDSETQSTLDVNFVGTETMRAWDAEAMPLVEGRTYTISGPETTSTSVNFVTLEGTYRQQDALAEALIAKGCTAQLAQLADALEAEAEREAE